MKTLIYALLIYVCYRIIKRAFRFPAENKTSASWKTNVQSAPKNPPPYDSANVEDIEFEAAKSRKQDS